MRYIEIIFGIFLLIICLSAAFLGLVQFRSGEYIEEHIVTTSSGVDGYTTGTVTLALDLYDGEISGVTITSDDAADAPVPFEYIPTTKRLTISGLEENTTRRLTITYLYNRLAAYPGADLASKIVPVLLVFAIIGLVGIAVYGIWPKGRGGG
jgi:hypothetical protein